MFKKVIVTLVMIGIVGGSMLAPLFSARAQNNNPQFALSNGAIEKDPNGTKYRWVIGVGAVNTTSGGSTVVIGGSSTTGSTGNTSSNLIPADIRITTGTTVASLVELTRVSIDIPNNQPYTFTSDYILEADSGYSAQIYKRGSTSITYSESIAIHINPQGQVTGTGTADGSTISTENGDNNGLPVCWQGPTSVHVSGCIAQGVYYALFVPTSFLFSLSGQLLDWAMGFTLDSNSYKGSGATFVEQGWKIARDIANIMFIFILLWAGIGTILGNHNVNAKNTIKNVILVALLLNFSLFFARVVIDASNILGGVFYNNIGVNDTANVSNPWITDTKNVSVAIVSKFNPQSIFEQANTLKLTSQSGVPEAVGVNGAPPPGQFIIISLIMTVINCIGIWVFASVAFLFMARVAGLWILMIFAPIAFISLIMPSSGGKILGEMSFSSWWSKLISQAFVVPVFMFFMYLIIMFMNTNFFRDLGSDKTTTQIILGVLIPLLIIVTLLMRARKIALDMSGEIGGAVVKAGTALAGGAIGLAAGGYALAGRATLGRLGYNATQNQSLKDAAAKGGAGGFIARATLAASNKLSTASFDARNTAVGNKLSEKTGMNLNKGLSFAGLDTKSTDGGWLGLQARKAEKDDKYGKSLGYDEHKYKDEEKKIEKEKDKQTNYKDIKEDLQNQIRIENARIKTLPDKSDEKNAAQKKVADLTQKAALVDQNIRAYEKGGKVFAMNAQGEYVDKNGKVVATKAQSSMEESLGIQKMEKNKERIKTAREKQWQSTLMRRSGKRYLDDERDELGNIKEFGKEITSSHISELRTELGDKRGKALAAQDTAREVGKEVLELDKKIAEAKKKGTTITEAETRQREQLKERYAQLLEKSKKASKEMRSTQNKLSQAQSTILKTNWEGTKQIMEELGKGFAQGSGLVLAGATGAGMINEGFAPGSTVVAASIVGGVQAIRRAIEWSGKTNESHSQGHLPHAPHTHATYHEPSGGQDTPSKSSGHSEAKADSHGH